MTLADLWAYVRDGGMLFLLFLILVGGWKRYWVWGSAMFPPAPRTQTASIVSVLCTTACDTAVIVPSPSTRGPSAMLVPVLPNTHHDEILWPIVVFVAVQMMDVLATGQRAAKHLLCYDAMLIHVRLSLPNFQAYVTPWRGVPPTLPTGVTRATHSALLLCSCASGTLIGAVGVLAGFRRRLPACWTQTLVGHGLTSLEVLPNDNRSKP